LVKTQNAEKMFFKVRLILICCSLTLVWFGKINKTAGNEYLETKNVAKLNKSTATSYIELCI